jgi:hypothetical protein
MVGFLLVDSKTQAAFSLAAPSLIAIPSRRGVVECALRLQPIVYIMVVFVAPVFMAMHGCDIVIRQNLGWQLAIHTEES